MGHVACWTATREAVLLMLIHRAGQNQLFIPGGSLGLRAYSAGEIGGAGGVTSTRSVQFDGTDDRIDTPLDIGSTFSVSCWLKLTGIGSSGYPMAITAAGSPDLELGFTGDGLSAFYSSGSFFTGVTIPLNTWFHVAWVCQSSQITIYINGTLVDTRSYSPTTLTDITIGCRYGGFHFWQGIIDDPRIYNTALTTTDVANLAAGVDVTAGLVAYWPLEEGSGTTTVDTIGGNNGTLTNGPTWSTDVPAPIA